jgi:uncharacterized protein (DUF2147 family)
MALSPHYILHLSSLRASAERRKQEMMSITFTRHDHSAKIATTLTMAEVMQLALIGASFAQHYQRAEKSRGTVAVIKQMRKQGLKHDLVSATLRLNPNKAQAPKEPTL